MTAPPVPPRKPRDDEIDAYGLTHIGKVRKENQDHFLLAAIHKRIQVFATNLDADRLPPSEERLATIAMVADGVGGGEGGGEASATALEVAMQYLNHSVATYYGADADEAGFADALQAAAMRSHEVIVARRAAEAVRGTMATTLTMLMFVWPSYYLLQVGDSRYYRYRHGKLTQVTRDQTIAQRLVDEGVIPEAAAARSPFAHVLSSALGGDTALPVVTRLELDWNTVHLLCSDGLTKHVTDARIAEVLGTMTSARGACEQLLQEALDGGGSDNIAIIVGRGVRRDTP